MTKFLLIVSVLLIATVYNSTVPLDFNFDVFKKLNDPFPKLHLRILPSVNDQSPCGFKSFCGEAASFRFEKELKAFMIRIVNQLYFIKAYLLN